MLLRLTKKKVQKISEGNHKRAAKKKENQAQSINFREHSARAQMCSWWLHQMRSIFSVFTADYDDDDDANLSRWGMEIIWLDQICLILMDSFGT